MALLSSFILSLAHPPQLERAQNSPKTPWKEARLSQSLLRLQWEMPSSSTSDAVSHLSGCQSPGVGRSKPTRPAVPTRCQHRCREMHAHADHRGKLVTPKPE